MPNGITSHDTSDRLFQLLDPVVFAETFALWTQSLREHLDREVVALDGKSVRRAAESGLTLGQSLVAEKSNEITAVPALLWQLELAGCIVTPPCTARRRPPGRSSTPTPITCWPSRATKAPPMGELKAYLDDAVARLDP